MLAAFSLWLQTTRHLDLNFQGPQLEFAEASPPWRERRTIWKGLNSALSRAPEAGLLTWVHTIPSPAHPPSEAEHGSRDWIRSTNAED